MAAWVWFAIAVLLGAAEMVGGEFVLLMLAGGALAGGVTALFTAPMDAAFGGSFLWLQVLVFAIASLVLVFGLRPHLKRRYLKPSQIRSGIDAIIGSQATVISTVNEAGGQVKIGGEIWSAVGMDGMRALPPGTPVTVVEIRGATAVVMWGP